MAYRLLIPEHLNKIFLKLSKRNKKAMQIIERKVKQILEDPCRFKPLKGNMAGIWRVHIGKSFVLTYEILEGQKIIKLLDLDHHDKIYKQ